MKRLYNRFRSIKYLGIVNALRYEQQIFNYKLRCINVKRIKYPIYIRNTKSDRFVFEQIIKNQEYRISIDRNKKLTIIDCGANIGMATVYFKNLFPKSSILSIEPDNDNFILLCKNVEKYDNVKCLRLGVWGYETKLSIKDLNAESSSIQFFENSEDHVSNDMILSATIGDIISKYDLCHIDILKIDIEGAEKSIFENDTKWLSIVDHLMVELHDRYVDGCSMSFFKAIKDLRYTMDVQGELLVFHFIH